MTGREIIKIWVVAAAVFMVMAGGALAQKMVHPLDFKGSDAEKEAVIAYIKYDVKKRYSAIGMDNPSTLRMMENKELDAFKNLANVADRGLLNAVIDRYCDIGMCNYSTFLMMYEKEEDAAKKSLKW